MIVRILIRAAAHSQISLTHRHVINVLSGAYLLDSIGVHNGVIEKGKNVS
jgi:hypothetical protein